MSQVRMMVTNLSEEQLAVLLRMANKYNVPNWASPNGTFCFLNIAGRWGEEISFAEAVLRLHSSKKQYATPA